MTQDREGDLVAPILIPIDVPMDVPSNVENRKHDQPASASDGLNRGGTVVLTTKTHEGADNGM